MSSSCGSPYGPATGLALDVIIVVPSPSCRHSARPQGRVSSPKRDSTCDLGVMASSDFYVTFPSSVLAAASMNSSGERLNASPVTKLKRWTSSFLYNTPSSSSRSNESSAKREGSLKHMESDHSVDYSMDPDAHQATSNNKVDTASSATPEKGNIQIHINGRPIRDFEMNLTMNKTNEPVSKFVIGNGLRPPTGSLEMLVDEAILNYGRNLIRYILFNEKEERIASAEAFLYLWSARDSVIVCDIDGTITKSDVRGVLDTVVQDNFKHIHKGVCKFLNKLMSTFETIGDEDEGSSGGQLRFFYLSSRPISYISQTRKLLVGLSQEEEEMSYGLPPGPIMCHRGSLSTVLHSELVAKNVYDFKADVLARQIVLPFVAAIGNSCKHKFMGDSSNDQSDNLWRSESDLSELTINAADDRLFLAGFGNKVTDARAYELAGIDRRDIYIINKESVIQCLETDGLNRSSAELFSSNMHNISTISRDTDVSEFCCGFEISDGALSREVVRGDANIEYAISSEAIQEEELDFSPQTLEVQPVKSSRSKKKMKQAKQTIRAFSLKKSFASFRSQDSLGEAFFGYDDPKLLSAVSERMKKPLAENG